MTTDSKPKSKRGFASMSPEKRREIAAMGGRSLKREQRTFFKDRELAAEAGRVGGRSVPAEKRSYSVNADLATEAGRKGGEASKGKPKRVRAEYRFDYPSQTGKR